MGWLTRERGSLVEEGKKKQLLLLLATQGQQQSAEQETFEQRNFNCFTLISVDTTSCSAGTTPQKVSCCWRIPQ